MAEEFVDLYEVLELPVDADRNTLRKRINELYLDAQRNLDHRNFATRVKYQELFEVTMPQARYILLDDGRRDEYTRLVHAFRASQGGASTPPQPAQPAEPKPVSSTGFSLEEPIDTSLPGDSNTTVEPLPVSTVDPAQLAQEREELWKKWKAGLEEAIHVEGEVRPKARSAVTAAPTSFSIQPEAPTSRKATPVPAAPAAVQAPAAAPSQPATKPATRPKVDISFDFTEKEPAKGPAEIAAEVNRMSDFAAAEHAAMSPAEIESRRTEHRRQIMKEVLVNVGLIWGIIGALLVIVPGTAALIAAVGHYYPRNAPPLLQFSPNLIWGGGFALIAILAFVASRELSKSMRRKTATDLSYLSYEDLLKKVKKG